MRWYFELVLRIDGQPGRLYILCIICAVLTEGCATIFTLSPDRVEGSMYESPAEPQSFPRLYAGFIGDGYCLTDDRSGAGRFFCLIDLPLSLVADTVVLPYTAVQQIRHGNYHARCIPEQREEKRREQRKQVEMALDLCRKQQAQGKNDCPSMIADDGTVLLPPPTTAPLCPPRD